MDNENRWLSIGEAARYLGISRDTLRRWEKRGKIKALRSPTNRRYYTKKQLDTISINQPIKPQTELKTVKANYFNRNQKLIVLIVLGFIIGLIIFYYVYSLLMLRH